MFLVPSTMKVIHKSKFMTQEALETYRLERMSSIMSRLKSGNTYDNHHNLSELVEVYGQMKGKARCI